MKFEFNNKIYNMADSYFNNCSKLGMTKEEIIEMWLDDEGITENEEQTAMDKKAKETKAGKAVTTRKVTKKVNRKSKEDKTKEDFIKKLADLLKNEGISDVIVTNPTKMIEFNIGNEHFKLDFTRSRPKKE